MRKKNTRTTLHCSLFTSVILIALLFSADPKKPQSAAEEFDKGHLVEEMARPLVGRTINDELFLATVISDGQVLLIKYSDSN